MFPKIGFFPLRSSILIGVSIIKHPFWGTTICGNTQIFVGKKFMVSAWWALGDIGHENLITFQRISSN